MHGVRVCMVYLYTYMKASNMQTYIASYLEFSENILIISGDEKISLCLQQDRIFNLLCSEAYMTRQSRLLQYNKLLVFNKSIYNPSYITSACILCIYSYSETYTVNPIQYNLYSSLQLIQYNLKNPNHAVTRITQPINYVAATQRDSK